jgi:hypothetical protein
LVHVHARQGGFEHHLGANDLLQQTVVKLTGQQLAVAFFDAPQPVIKGLAFTDWLVGARLDFVS